METTWEWISTNADPIMAVGTVLAAFIAAAGIWFAVRDNRARSQPMMTAEMRPAADSESAVDLVITNAGPTPARDVKVEFDPPLRVPPEGGPYVTPFLIQRYARPIAVINPARELSNVWWSGRATSGNELENGEPTPDEVTVTLSYRGLGRRQITEQYRLHVDTVKLTTYSVSSTSVRGRIDSIKRSLEQIAAAQKVLSSDVIRANRSRATAPTPSLEPGSPAPGEPDPRTPLQRLYAYLRGRPA